MSQKDVDLVRDGLDAFNRRDRARWLALCHPEYEAVPSGDWPESDPIRGREAAWDFYVDVEEAWEGAGPYVVGELFDAENGRIAAHLTREVRGKASTAAVRYDYWIVSTVIDGAISRGQFFESRAQALAAVAT